MIRIYADFNSKDTDGRVWLNTVCSKKDIEKHEAELREGLEVILYVPDEFEVRGKLVRDRGIWKGHPDWSTIRYKDKGKNSKKD